MTTLEVRERAAYAQVAAEPQHIQDRFWELIEKGNTAIAALMFASQRSPTSKGGDRVFNENARKRMEDMLPEQRKKILELAKKAGISTQGKYYCGGLGRYDDPAAWVSTTDDVVASARAKGLIVTGAVNHDPGENAALDSQRRRMENPGLAKDIVEDLVRQRIMGDERLQAEVKKNPQKTFSRLRGEVAEKHAPPKKP